MIKQRKDLEIEVLNRYLPEMLSEEEIPAEVAAVLSEAGASGMADMGKVMGALKSRLAGKADMAVVNQAVKAALSR